MLTLFVIEVDDGADKALESVGYLVENAYITTKDELENDVKEFCTTEWFMVMYSDERLSQQMLEALSIYMDRGEYDVMVLFRYIDEGNFSISPRLFRKSVQLDTSSGIHFKNVDPKKVLKVADAWIWDKYGAKK